MIPLPTAPIQRLDPRPTTQRWLIEALWAHEAVGILGGEPKCGKSFLALQIAVAVASGTACLGRFAPRRTGRVLVYAAEDPPHLVRERVEGIAALTGAAFEALDLHLITRESIRIDLPDEQRALAITIEDHRPALLVLDPFVRLHRADENASSEIAPILAALRALQRQYALAILVVHHAKKAAARIRAGQALRGSSDFHAWGDSNLYLRRQRNRLVLSVEHRAHRGIADLTLVLQNSDRGTGLVIDDHQPSPDPEPLPSPSNRILSALANAIRPLGHAELRAAARLRHQVFCQRLTALVEEGLVVKTARGYEAGRHHDER
jgi:hypothetical protein